MGDFHGGTPNSWLDGLFHGQFHEIMDDEMGLPDFRTPHYVQAMISGSEMH
jgi:hypothetical protein